MKRRDLRRYDIFRYLSGTVTRDLRWVDEGHWPYHHPNPEHFKATPSSNDGLAPYAWDWEVELVWRKDHDANPEFGEVCP